MYQPKIRDDQVTQLYLLARGAKRPMTQLIREAVDQYLTKQAKGGDTNEDQPRSRQTSTEGRPGV
jgi:hypothetical protein